MITFPLPKKYLSSVIPRANYNTIEKILLFNRDDIIEAPQLIEEIYGLALFRTNERIISLVNLFVRENNIKINRYNVLDRVYLGVILKDKNKAKEDAKRCPSREDMCSYANFSDLKKLQLEYIHKYWNMFEVKDYKVYK